MKLSSLHNIVLGLNIVAIVCLGLVYLDQFNFLGRFSVIYFLNLFTPYWIGINILFLLYWMLFRKAYMWLSVLILLPALFALEPFFKVNNSTDSVPKEDDISVLSFNVHSFYGPRWSRDKVFSNGIIDFILEQDADILSLQEFDHKNVKVFDQYPHSFVNYIFPDGNHKVVQAIFSKYPIVSKGSLDFPDSRNNAIFADIVVASDTLRVYNVHLQSLRFRFGSIKREEPQRLYQRLGDALAQQARQAKLLAVHAKGTTYRKIITGDFNNTQYSYVYRTIKEDLKDTFQEKGRGFGNTYHLRFLPFRIDFILVDPSFEVTSHKNFDVRFSDHLPIMASFRLEDKE